MNFPTRKKLLLVVLFSLFSLVPLTKYSLWIDESSTAFYSSQNTIHDLNTRLLSSTSSEIQMPGYIYYMWVWVKLFGHEEYILRLSNIPFLIFLFIVLFSAPLSDRLKTLSAVFIILCPFIWYNLNEARSTIPVFIIAGISIIAQTYYFLGGKSDRTLAIIISSACLIIGSAFNMLFIIFIPVWTFLFIWQVIVRKFKFRTIMLDWWVGVLFIAIFITPIVLFYFWTLDKDSGGFRETPNIMNLAFLLYEHLGFSGIGPPRNILRNSFSDDVIKPYLPLLGLYALIYLMILLNSVSINIKRRKDTKHFILNPYLFSYLFGVAIFSIISIVFNFRFLGRHAAFLLPFLLFFLAMTTEHLLYSHPSKWPTFMFLLFLVMTLFSDVNIRFNEAYKKENNKEAALMAIQSADESGVIIWNGFERLADYYGLKISSDKESYPRKWKVKREAIKPSDMIYESRLSDYLDSLRNKGSVLIIFNRPEFDSKGYYQNYIEKNRLKQIYKHRDFILYSME